MIKNMTYAEVCSLIRDAGIHSMLEVEENRLLFMKGISIHDIPFIQQACKGCKFYDSIRIGEGGKPRCVALSEHFFLNGLTSTSCCIKIAKYEQQKVIWGRLKPDHGFHDLSKNSSNMKYTLSGLELYYDINSYMDDKYFLYFWKHIDKEGEVTKACLSQWYSCDFEIDGIRYNCSEQYMMAEKARIFGDEDTRNQILKSTDPAEMKKLGRKVAGFVSAVWDNISYEIVVRGNVAKFSQNPKLLGFLLMTGNKVLVEASPYDNIWGIGMDEKTAKPLYPHIWRGQNKLGFALMEVRDIIIDRLR